MSSTYVTEEQRAWANRVLGILGEKSSDLDPSRTKAGSQSDSDSEPIARYGAGYNKFKGQIHGALKESLDQKLPPKVMISASDWDNLANSKEVETERKNALNVAEGFESIVTQRNLAIAERNNKIQELRDKRSPITQTLDSLESARLKGTACNLTEKPPLLRNVTLDEIDKEFERLSQEERELYLEIQHLEDSKSDDFNGERDWMATCLPLLDSPANNPERAKVGDLLKELEAVEKEIAESNGKLNAESARKKVAALAALEKQLFAWNDRRAAQNLPPSTEAVALLDLHQIVHQEFVADVVKSRQLDPPIAGYHDLAPPEEKEKLAQMWNDLVAGKGSVAIENISEQFSKEMLANFARLMASQAGRYLINELNVSGKGVKITKYTEMAASTTTDEGKFDSQKQQARSGSGSRVLMPTGKVLLGSNDVSYTENGNYLYNPAFIGLGHELVHALHYARGKGRDSMSAEVQDDEWHNQEEYRTIFKGKTTENTLRHQYGLAMERFGHGDVSPREEVTSAFVNAVKASKELENEERRRLAEENLKHRNFDPSLLSDVKKLEYETSEVDGEALYNLGWNPNQLTVVQAQAVIAQEILFTDLEKLGWVPYELHDVKGNATILDIVNAQKYHPRSPQGHRFQTLGGKVALEAIITFNSKTNANLRVDTEGNGVAQFKALEEADAWLSKRIESDPSFADWARNWTGKKGSLKKLTNRLTRAAEFLQAKNRLPLPTETIETKTEKTSTETIAPNQTFEETKKPTQQVLSEEQIKKALEDFKEMISRANSRKISAEELRQGLTALKEIQNTPVLAHDSYLGRAYSRVIQRAENALADLDK